MSNSTPPPVDPAPALPQCGDTWIRLVGRPELEQWATPEAEPVDFTCFQADNGEWQLIACIRNTSQPGGGRLLYRWSSTDLFREGWTPEGIFLSSRSEWGHREGQVQAPFHVQDGGVHSLFYNSGGGAYRMTSTDGIRFEPDGTAPLFLMGRDICLLDDRKASGNWIAYYTSPEPGINPATGHHTIRARTAPDLSGPWSDPALETPPLTPPPPDYAFVYAESPLVIQRFHSYYRFEQLQVFHSRDPLRWDSAPLMDLDPEHPLKFLAPEIVHHDGHDYLLAYQWRNQDPRGIYLTPLTWKTGDSAGG